MTEEERPRLPFPEPPDPLEVLEAASSAIEGFTNSVTDINTRLAEIDQKTSEMDKRFTIPPIFKKAEPPRKPTCKVCEQIAEHVSGKMEDPTQQKEVYDAVLKLTHKDEATKLEGMHTLRKLGLLKTVSEEIKEKYEELKHSKN